MEPNPAVTAKKIWSIVRVLFFMLRKAISKKSKFILDLNMMIKRGKIAGKALHNLMFHHHHPNRHLSFDARPGEYEFSCSNSPAYPISLFPFHLNKNRKRNGGNNNSSHFFSCAHAPATDDDDVTVNAVMKALEMLHSGAVSPVLPGFGRSPMVRQLRITDSPFPPRDVDVELDSHVDEAAEEFIMKFYKELKKQNIMPLS